MRDMGYIVLVGGFVFVFISGAFFYSYFQQLIGASTSSATGSSTTTAEALNILNGTANTPLFITLSIFGFAFLIMGSLFIVGGNIGEQLADQQMSIQELSNQPRFSSQHTTTPVGESETIGTRPLKACTKCGSLIWQNSAYCPICGNPLAKVQSGMTIPST